MKVCFIGLGSIGSRHCRNVKEICAAEGIPVTIHAVRTSDRPLSESLQELGLVTLHSYEEMDRDYDAIFITNPTALHYDALLRVGDKAACFFIEKPVFEREEEESVLPLRPDAKTYVAAPLRYTGAVQAAREIVEKHRIYCARAISSSYLPDWRPGVDYRKVYSARRDQGGGVSIDLIHEWDYLTMLFGFPKRVSSVIGRYSDLEIDSDDLAIYVASYPDKAVEVHLDYFGRKTVRQLELFTQEGTYLCDIAGAKVRYPDGTEICFQEQPNDKYLAEMRYFLSLVKGERKTSANSIRHAQDVLKLTKGEWT